MYREVNQQGSLAAWGTGIHYEYDPLSRVLAVIHTRQQKPLLYANLDKALSRSPVAFIETLEKTLQISALKLSNNASVDITALLREHRLLAIIETGLIAARYSLALKHGHFRRFENYFCERYDLSQIKIKKIKSFRAHTGFYTATIVTRNNNEAIARATSLHGVVKKLGEQIISDLIFKEFGYNFSDSAHKLLSMSSMFLTMSYALNTHFIPQKKVFKRETIQLPHQGQAFNDTNL